MSTWASRSFAVLLAASLAWVGCRGEPALVRMYEARRLVDDVRVAFARAAGASDRAVMADSDEAAKAFVHEARTATEQVARDAARLGPLLRGLNAEHEAGLADTFQRQLAEYRKVDDGLLAMAGENTNLEAQRLSFGPVREAADAFEAAVRATAAAAPAKDRERAGTLALEAALAVRGAQILQAPHIAEAEDAKMTSLEAQLAAAEKAAAQALDGLAAVSGANVAPARQSLERFSALTREVVRLSRRNSNVRSLAVAVRQKPALTGACDATLTELSDALAKAYGHLGATR
jgi:hypothetical protein